MHYGTPDHVPCVDQTVRQDTLVPRELSSSVGSGRTTLRDRATMQACQAPCNKLSAHCPLLSLNRCELLRVVVQYRLLPAV